jgi:hypothetical protein
MNDLHPQHPLEQPSQPRPHEEDERFLRNRDLVDQRAINRHPVAIVGLGAIGSQLAEQLAKLGVEQFVLLDPDVVSRVNLAVQGFYEEEVGMAKVHAVADRLQKIRHSLGVETFAQPWRPNTDCLPRHAVVFAAVDSISVRRQLYDQQLLRRKAPCLFDARMSAETFQCFGVPRDRPDLIHAYGQSLFPQAEAHRERCTARATIYCAAMAAAALCAMYKRWMMREQAGFWHSRLELSVRTFDVIQSDVQFTP